MGLLDSDFLDPTGAGIMAMAGALLTPRYQGGGFGPAFMNAGEAMQKAATAQTQRALANSQIKSMSMENQAKALGLYQQLAPMEAMGYLPPGSTRGLMAQAMGGQGVPPPAATPAAVQPSDAPSGMSSGAPDSAPAQAALAAGASQGDVGPTVTNAQRMQAPAQASQPDSFVTPTGVAVPDRMGLKKMPGMPALPEGLGAFINATYTVNPNAAVQMLHNYLNDLPKYEAKDQYAMTPQGLRLMRGNSYGGSQDAGYTPAEETTQVDLGGTKQLQGKYTGNVVSSGSVTNTPYQNAELVLRGAELGLNRQRLALDTNRQLWDMGNFPNATSAQNAKDAYTNGIGQLNDMRAQAIQAKQGLSYIDTMEGQLGKGIFTGSTATPLLNTLNALGVVLPQDVMDKVSRTQVFDHDAIQAVGAQLKQVFGARPAAQEFQMLLQANANKTLQPKAIQSLLEKSREILQPTVDDYGAASDYFKQNGNLVGYTPKIMVNRPPVTTFQGNKRPALDSFMTR
jgi:hypothetical protein